jgi:BirA family biotin operon repressor/biotin-[acetyl-CoA-carboxylase] ligase
MLGNIVLRFDQLASTNDLAREMAASGTEEGVVVTAREQTAGRGRMGRNWSSPAGEGLYLSLILRPQIKPEAAPVITLAAAVAVAETLKLDLQVEADIKWPNDVLASGRKICGILVETATEKDQLLYAVMGIGINLAQREFPEELREIATSVLIECRRLLEGEQVLAMLIRRLDHWYTTSLTEPDRVIARWSELSSYSNGCVVSIETAQGIIEGVTRGLATSGALIIETSAGQRREITSGEVRLRRQSVVSSP